MEQQKSKGLSAVLLAALAAIFPVAYMYCQNIKTATLVEALPVVGIYLVSAVVLFLILYGCSKKAYKSAIVAAVAVLICSNYTPFQTLVFEHVSGLRYWHLAAIVLFLIFVFGLFVFEKLSDNLAEMVYTGVLVALGVVILMNIIPAVPKGIAKMKSAKAEQTQKAEEQIATTQDLPNVYYLVFDEYASNYQMENYYKYDNSAFSTALEEKGFCFSTESRNDCGNTTVVLTNILSLDYTTDEATFDGAAAQKLRDHAALYQEMRDMGYTVKGIGDTGWMGLPTDESSASVSKTVQGQTFTQMMLQNTIAGPLMQTSYSEFAKVIVHTIDQLQSPEITQNKNQFVVSYLSTPHQPFLFDENGQDVAAANYNNWDDDRYYVGQYQYITKQIQLIVDNIIENDPNSIIYLASDHGARFKAGVPYNDIIRVLNTVYYKGEDISEIQGLSGVNTWRAILNRLGTKKFEMVEVPQA